MSSHWPRLSQPLALFITTCLFSACTAIKPAQLPDVAHSGKQLITRDLRDKRDSATEILSYVAASCQFGIQRLGDEWTTPGKVDYLSATIESQLPSRKTLEINRFVLYLNMQNALREGNVFRGPLMQLLECDENTEQYANYLHRENPRGLSIVIGTLEGKLDNEPFSARATSILSCAYDSRTCTDMEDRAAAARKVIVELTRQAIASSR